MTQEEFKSLSKEEQKKVKWADLPSFNKNAIIALIATMVILISTCLFVGDDEPASSSITKASEKEVVYNSEWDGSVKQVKEYLNANLNDAGSYESVEWGKVVKVPRDVMITETEDPYDTRQINVFLVRHKYRAKNAFGAMILKHEIFTLDSTGRVIEQAECHL